MIKIKHILTFTMCLIQFALYAQVSECYYILTDLAFIKYQQKDYKESLNLYEKAFSFTTDTLPFHLKITGEIHSYLGNNLKATNYLEKAIEKGITHDKINVSDHFKASTHWSDLTNEYSDIRSRFKSKLSLNKIAKLHKLVSIDQFVRRNKFSFEEKRKWISYADSINIHELLDMVKTEGFPTYLEVGKKGTWDAHLIILHGIRRHDDARNYFLDILKKEIYTGNISPHEYANIVDMYEVQTLNTSSMYGNFRSKKHPYGIRDIPHLDKRRVELGLLPFSYEAEKRNWPLPEGYVQLNIQDYLDKECFCNKSE